MRLIDADEFSEEVERFFMAITGNPKPTTVVRECKKSFAEMIEGQPTVLAVENNAEKVTDWEQEAKRQCSAAGELRIQLGERLEEIRTRLSAMRQMLCMKDNTMDQVILTWKISQMEEQAAWLESVLWGKRSGAGQAADEVGQAPEGKEP